MDKEIPEEKILEEEILREEIPEEKIPEKEKENISEDFPTEEEEFSVLQLGSKGEEVFFLQEILKKEKYFFSSPDGIFGEETRDAVIAFQKVYGFKKDGIVDYQTWQALINPQKLTPIPKYREIQGIYIEVDLKRQILLLVKDGKIERIIHISSGKRGMETPQGEFEVTFLWPGWHKVVGRPWGGEMYNAIYFKGAYAIHGMKNVPVYPASHGCVRVPIRYADKIFQMAGKIGTKIYIY